MRVVLNLYVLVSAYSERHCIIKSGYRTLNPISENDGVLC